MRISRCAWHPRNYGHAKLLGVRSWRGRGIAFTAGLCDKCAARIHPAVRPMVIREVKMPKRGGTAIVVGVCAAMTGLVVVAWPTSDVPPREFPAHRMPSLPREMPPPHVALLPQGTHSGSPVSAGRVSLARTSRLTEPSTPRAWQDLYQAP